MYIRNFETKLFSSYTSNDFYRSPLGKSKFAVDYPNWLDTNMFWFFETLIEVCVSLNIYKPLFSGNF